MENTIEGRVKQTFLLAVVALALFLDGLDGTIVNIVLPDVAASFGINTGSVSWVVTIYFLMMAGLILIIGKIADGGAIKKLFIWGLVMFTLSSLACGLSESLTVLLAFRAIQGVGAAMMATTAFILCVKYFPRKMTAFALSMGVFGISLGAAVGPALGGLLTELVSWYLVFFINVPIGLVVTALAMHVIPKDPRFITHGFDIKGTVTLFVSMVCVLYVIESSPSHEFDALSLTLLTVLVVSFALFIIVERRSPDPVLKLRLFRLPRLDATIVVLVLINIVYMGCLYLLPFYLQIELILGSIDTGIYLFIPAVATLVFCVWIGKVADRFGNRPFVVTGCLCMVVATLLLYLMGPGGGTMLLAGLALLGITWGIAGGPLGSRMLENVPNADRPSASTLMSFFMYFGCALGTATFAGLFRFGSRTSFSEIGDLSAEVFMSGFEFCMAVAVVFTVVATVLSWAVRDIKGGASDE